MSFKNYTRGGQITAYTLRMFVQNNKWIAKWLFVFWLLATLIVFMNRTGHDELVNGMVYWGVSFLQWLGFSPETVDHFFSATKSFSLPYHGGTIIQNTESILGRSSAYFDYQGRSLLIHLFQDILMGLLLTMIFGFIISRWLSRKGRKQGESKFVRGMKLTDNPAPVARMMRRKKIASDIVVSGLPFNKGAEVQGIMVHGTLGTGKSQTIIQLMEHIRERGDKVIVYDKGCSLTPLFFSQGDKMLNPYDERCQNWDLWAECQTMPDFDNMAESLIPMAGENDPFWVYSARTIFASTAYKMKDDPERSLEKLLERLLTIDMNQLQSFLANTEGSTLVSDKVEKTAISIRGVLTNYVKSLRYLQGLGKKQSFCLRDWLHDEVDRGWVFVSSNAEQHSSIRPLISMWLAMASIRLLGMNEDRSRRVWFIMDELPSLHKLPNLPETMAEARKFGGCFVVGLQSFPQLVNIYGKNAAAAIFDLLNTRLFYRSPSQEVAQLVEKELGEEEIEDMREQLSYGPDAVRDGVSLGSQRVRRPIVSASEVTQLEDLCCYVRQPGDVPVVKLKMDYQDKHTISPGFIRRSVNEKLSHRLEEQVIASETAFAAVTSSEVETAKGSGKEQTDTVGKEEKNLKVTAPKENMTNEIIL